ncbi:serine/threonine-protein kinase [Pendulispora brunnea]|uniref:Serine/threonine-protein kinase n=1 Tax=Pendulispora brunnea TaxID=2905690 RepID=A0ABZ2K566_9BACT
MPCPSHEELLALAEGALDEASQVSIQAHVAECASCKRARERLASQSAPSQTLTSHARSPADRPGRHRRADSATIQPGTYVGRYLVIDLIGTGGMGSVYRAYDPKLNRNVAVKLIRVRSSDAEDAPRPRLLREAQALAKVVHPHVVSIFDVGEFSEQVFFAMELIEGSTLRDVMRRPEQDKRRLLKLLDQAGRGLAAAHAAGLVHRDFKPENVLIDREQRVKVADFGLARAIDAQKSEDLVSVPPGEWASVLDRRITETGAFIGTPAYMSPEQYLGLRTDARSDQFSFCCVTYEALFGRHPFLGKNGKISPVALCAGQIEVPGRRSDPGYLPVLRRGLSRDPSNRYPSIEHLLDALAGVPRRRQRRIVGIAAAVCAAVGFIGVPIIQKHRAQRCEAAATQALADIWDTPRRVKVENVFGGDGKAFGRDIWQRVANTLDAYANQWTQTSAELCRNTEWWRNEDNAMHKRSSSCLDERRRELRAVTDVLSGGDRDVRLRAPDMLIQLGSLSACTNAAALAATPLAAYDKATAASVERIRDLLAQSRAHNDARQVAPGEEAARQALELARTHHQQALVAESLYRLSQAQSTGNNFEASESNIVQALAEAEASGHERLLPLIWNQLIIIVGFETDRPNEVERLLPWVESMVKRIDPEGPAHIEFSFVRGLLEKELGHYERSIELFNAALEMSRHAFGENDIRRIMIYQQLAISERTIGQLEAGAAHARAALAEAEAMFGPEHPQNMKTLSLLARILSEQGDSAGTRAVAERTLRIVEQVSSAENLDPDVPVSLSETANALLADGQPADALPLFRRSYDLFPVKTTDATVSLAGIARSEEALGHLEAARTTFEQVLAVNRRLLGPGHPGTLTSGARFGRVLRSLHREGDALQLCTQLLADGERKAGPQGVAIAMALSCVGESYEQLGQLPNALTALERAKKLLDGEKTPRRENRAVIDFALARVLWQTGADRERARRLATEAADDYQHAGRANAQNAVAVQSWLAKAAL